MTDADRDNPDAETREFLSHPETAKAGQLIMEAVQREGDRGAMLVAGEMLSAFLGDALRRLQPGALEASDLDRLTKGVGPLASWSSRSRVAALVILNSPHERSPEAQRLVEERAAQTGAGGPAANIDATLARWFTPQFLTNSPEMVARVRATVLANDPQSYTGHRQVLASGVTELIRPNPPLTAQTLVMTCEHDSGSTPAMSHAIAAEIAGAECVIVPGLQHLGLIERPWV